MARRSPGVIGNIDSPCFSTNSQFCGVGSQVVPQGNLGYFVSEFGGSQARSYGENVTDQSWNTFLSPSAN